MSNNKRTPQEIFDDRYITAGEIQKRLSVQRTSILNARQSGRLPEPIKVGGTRTFIWVRKDVEKALVAWENNLKIIRRNKAKA